MDQRKALILAGILGVLIIVIVLGTIVYLGRSVQTSSNTKVVTSSPLPIPSTAISTTSSSNPSANTNPNLSTKTYAGTGFQIQYPKSWGLLTCSNSSNIELDPTSPTDQLKVLCSSAVKPVTVIVHSVSCPGQTVKLGNISAIKSVDSSGGRTDYRWCTLTNPMLDISTRYSPSGGPATATTDYSKQVEDMISKIFFGAGS